MTGVREKSENRLTVGRDARLSGVAQVASESKQRREMIRTLLTTAVLLACVGWVAADEKGEKDTKAGTAGGPPPGKGWRKNETPAPATPTPAPKQKSVTPAPPAPKQPTPPTAAKKPDDGIGPTVSKWARAGIHGRELAAKIHQLQATRAKTTSPLPTTTKPEKKGKPEATPTPPTPPTPKSKKPKDKGEDD